jgi:protein required for attachment to host cells
MEGGLSRRDAPIARHSTRHANRLIPVVLDKRQNAEELMSTWILVSDASRARLFSTNGETKNGWKLIEELTHPESRMHESVETGKEGRVHQPASRGHVLAVDPVSSQKEIERERFAQQLAQLLDHRYDQRSYKELVIVAPPAFLGSLRRNMPAKVTKHIVATVDKDYTLDPVHRLQEHLEAYLPSDGPNRGTNGSG